MSEQAVDLRSTWAVLRGAPARPPWPRSSGRIGRRAARPRPPAVHQHERRAPPRRRAVRLGTTGGYDAETQVLIATSTEILSRAARSSSRSCARTRSPTASPSTSRHRDPADHRRGADGGPGGGPRLRRRGVARSPISRRPTAPLTEAQRAQLKERLDTLSASLARSTARSKGDEPDRRDGGHLGGRAGGRRRALRPDGGAGLDGAGHRRPEEAARRRGRGRGRVGGGASVIQPASPGERPGTSPTRSSTCSGARRCSRC